MSGRFFGVGVGPGEFELLTLKGRRLIVESPVVCYPVIKGGCMARTIVSSLLTEESHIEVPVTIDSFLDVSSVYDSASAEVCGHLESDRDVVFLCEGDPFFYGSFVYMYERLSERFDCEIVPGVSSVMASASLIGRPLGIGKSSVTVIPATNDDDEILSRLNLGGTVVFIKVGDHLDRLIGLVSSVDRLGDSYFVSRIGYADEVVVPLLGLCSGRSATLQKLADIPKKSGLCSDSSDIFPESADIPKEYFSVVVVYGADKW